MVAMRVDSPAPRGEWRDIIARDAEALPEHAPEWVDALCEGHEFADASRLYEFSDGRRFVLPLVRRRGPAGVGGWLTSYPIARGMGGLIGNDLDAGVVSSVVADLRQSGATRVWIRPNPLTANQWTSSRGTGVTAIARRAHVIDLAGGPDAVLTRMHRSTRRGLRVAERSGVRIEIDRTGRLLPVHYELFNASVERWARHQHEPLVLARWRAQRRDPLRRMQCIARHMGDAFVVLVAFVDDTPAASGITLLGQTAHDIRAAMDRDIAGPSRANELLQWHAVRLACERGCARHHLGESGNSVGLSQFKERFGAAAVPYAEYRIERLPYTPLDLALRGMVKRVLGFHDS
ncbi:GNAT family N-acetyltransferase [Rhodococcus spelaei]|nr:GNAT family N-acetyltransferase [Rhodococcus spelaei]